MLKGFVLGKMKRILFLNLVQPQRICMSSRIHQQVKSGFVYSIHNMIMKKEMEVKSFKLSCIR